MKIIVMDRTLKGLVSMVFFSHGVLIFLVLSMFFQCFYEHSGDLYTENGLTHCFDIRVVGIYLKYYKCHMLYMHYWCNSCC